MASALVLITMCRLSLCPSQVGERLGFGITIVLVLGVAEVIVAPYIPVCDNWLWSSQCVWARTTIKLESWLQIESRGGLEVWLSLRTGVW